MVGFPARGEVYWARLDPVVGSEIGKTRPVVIVQNDTGNEHSAATIVAAISSKCAKKRFPFLVPLPEGALPRPCVVDCAHLWTVDKSRLAPGCLAVVDADTMSRVDDALRASLGLL
jgi:mRNA interferase MazF